MAASASRISAIVAVVASVLTTTAFADQDRDDHGRDEPYAIGLWGDLPYSDVQAQVGVPNLIADMNRHELAFTVHAGDLTAGNGKPGSVTPTICSDALYVQALGFFNGLKAPAMLTPATTTDRLRSPVERRLVARAPDHERQCSFDAVPLGQHKLHQKCDGEALPRRQQPADGVRREPPLDVRRRHLPDQRAGLMQ
jgi:hypothetical protein